MHIQPTCEHRLLRFTMLMRNSPRFGTIFNDLSTFENDIYLGFATL